MSGHEFIVDLCLLRALKDDPRQLALLSYKHGRTLEDHESRIAEENRMKAYEYAKGFFKSYFLLV